MLEEVVVTARKREESIQDVPLSVTAYSGEALESAGYSDVASVASSTPNMEMESLGPLATFTYIRGIGTRRFDSGVDQSVGTFVDGLYRGRTYTTNTDLLMVERVEVLKGPQGTLYGKNTIGGAISLTTKMPDLTDWSAKLRYEPGYYDDTANFFHRESLFVSGPLVEDRLAVAAVVAGGESDGYQDVLDQEPPAGEVRRDVRGGDSSSESGKLKVVWMPADALEITASANKSDVDSTGDVFKPNDGGDSSTRPFLINPLLPNRPLISDPRTAVSNNPRQFSKVAVTTYYSSIKWTTDFATLRWIGGRETAEYSSASDYDGTGYDIAVNDNAEKASQESHEIRIEMGGERWDLLVGGYVNSEDIRRKEALEIGQDSIIAPLNLGQRLVVDFDSRFSVRSRALFGQFGYEVTDYIDLTLGLRNSVDEKEAKVSSVNDFLLPKVALTGVLEEYSLDLDDEWDSTDSLLSVSWKAFDAGMFYLTYSTGYKSGGFQWIAMTEEDAAEVLEPEYVDNYEVGMKSTWLDKRLRANVALFRMDYRDLQVLTYNSDGLIPVSVSENAAESRIEGLELDAVALLSSSWMMNLSYSYLDAVYEDYIQEPGDPSTQRSGNSMPRAPKSTASVGVVYTSDIARGVLNAGVRLSWKDSFFWEPNNNRPKRGQEEPELILLEANIGYEKGGFSLNLWGKNLTNEVYRTLIVDAGEDVQYFDFFAPPRSLGLQLQYQWN